MVREAMLWIADGQITRACALAEGIAQVQIARPVKVVPAAQVSAEAIAPTRRRGGPSLAVRARVYARDQYTCRYCNRKTVLEVAFVYLNGHFPRLVPHHPYWRTGFVHPLVPLITTSLDHIHPLARGGDNSEDNLAATCAGCNYTKNVSPLTELGWSLRSDPISDWDGATAALLRAMEVSRVDHPQIAAWMQVLQRG